MEVNYHIHLISDSTGETTQGVLKASIAQFEGISAQEHIWPMIRSTIQMEQVIQKIHENPGPVIFTLVSTRIRQPLRAPLRQHLLSFQWPRGAGLPLRQRVAATRGRALLARGAPGPAGPVRRRLARPRQSRPHRRANRRHRRHQALSEPRPALWTGTENLALQLLPVFPSTRT